MISEKAITEHKLSKAEIPAIIEQIKSASDKIIESGNHVMRIAALYHITGLSCFIVSIYGVFRQKRKIRFWQLPFGIFAGFLSVITM